MPESTVMPESTSPVVPTEVTELEEKTYTYHAKDEQGNPLGRPTVIKYHTEAELIAGMEKANEAAVRALYARNQTPDPEPEAKEPTLQELAEFKRKVEIRDAGISFINTHPDYHNVEANGFAITEYLIKNKMSQSSAKNIEIAYEALNREGKLLERPAPSSAPATPAVTANPEPVVVTPAPPEVRPVPGVKPGSMTNRIVPKKGLTLADVNALSPAERREKMRDPVFVAEVNRLGFEAQAKRAQRR